MGVFRTSAHITSKVLLLAQGSFVPSKFVFKPSDKRLHMLLIRLHTNVQLETFRPDNLQRDRIKLRILDACRLLELGTGLGLSRYQLCARAKRREVPPDGARLEQLEAIILLK